MDKIDLTNAQQIFIDEDAEFDENFEITGLTDELFKKIKDKKMRVFVKFDIEGSYSWFQVSKEDEKYFKDEALTARYEGKELLSYLLDEERFASSIKEGEKYLSQQAFDKWFDSMLLNQKNNIPFKYLTEESDTILVENYNIYINGKPVFYNHFKPIFGEEIQDISYFFSYDSLEDFIEYYDGSSNMSEVLDEHIEYPYYKYPKGTEIEVESGKYVEIIDSFIFDEGAIERIKECSVWRERQFYLKEVD